MIKILFLSGHVNTKFSFRPRFPLQLVHKQLIMTHGSWPQCNVHQFCSYCSWLAQLTRGPDTVVFGTSLAP